MKRRVIILLAVPIVAVTMLLVLLQHELTLKWLAARITASSNGSIVLNGVSGSLTSTLKIEEAIYQTPERKITAEDIEVSWNPSRILLGQIGVDTAYISRLTIESLASSKDPFVLPESLAPPMSVQVGKIQVDKLKYDGLEFDDLHLSLTADKTAWHLKDAGFESPFGAVSTELKLGSQTPYSLDGTVTVKHEKADGAAELAGHLEDIHFQGAFSGFGADVKVKARVTPFADFVLPTLTLVADNVDPSQVNPEWPQAKVQVRAEIETAGDQSLRGTINVTNRIPGVIDDNYLPIRTITGRLGGNVQTVMLENLLFDMGAGGQLSGKGKLSLNGVDLSLHASRLNLNAIYSSIRKTAIAGDILISAEEAQQVMTVKLAENRLSLDARAVHSDDQVHLPLFKLRAAEGEIQAEGKAQLSGSRSFVFNAQASRFNLSSLGKYPASDINATLQAQGHMLPDWAVSVNYALRPSRFLEQPLTGKGTLRATAKSLQDVDMNLALGPNTVSAKGAFGRSGDKLVWALNAPKLAVLGKPFQGELTGGGNLTGTFDALQAQLQLDGRDLILPGPIRAQSIHAQGRFGARPNDPLEATVQARNVVAADMQWQTLSLELNGKLQSHTLDAAALNSTMDLNAKATGGWNPRQGWTGEIRELANKGKQPFAQTGSASLRIGPRIFSLQDFNISLPDGKFVINKLEKTGSRIQSNGYAKGFPLRYITAFIPSLEEKVGGRLIFGAEWSVDMDRMLTGQIHAYRESGDLTIRSESSIKLGLSEMDVRITLDRNTLQARANVKGEATGVLNLVAKTELVRSRNGWHFPKQSPLQLLLEADMPSLDWISAVSGKSDMAVGGSLKMRINGSGTVGNPHLTGTLTGNALSFRWYSMGVKLQDGELIARLDNNRFVLEKASIQGDKGSLRIEGGGRFDNGVLEGNLSFVSDKLLLLSSPDRQLMISGQGKLAVDNEKLDISGKWLVDRALIQTFEYHDVNFSDDVVVIGREGKVPSEKPPLPIELNMSVDLGDNFKVDGWGLNARLKGTLQATSGADQGLRVHGTVSAVDATFSAYGQKLTVERGNVVFNGPVENPSLDILAVRKMSGFSMDNAVEAGVQIRGTPQTLRVKLVSTPNVPDSEKLSWLILGHGGAQNANDHDRSVVAAAATALLSTSSLGAIQSGLASTIGIDEIGIGTAPDMESTVLSVSKQLSSRLYLTYEQGISTVTNLVKLRYRVSNRVRLEAVTGTSTAIELLYEWSFD